MNSLNIIATKYFKKISCDFYCDETNNFFITREQIGRALEYTDPRRSISKIHERHANRLEKLSRVVTLEEHKTRWYIATGQYMKYADIAKNE